MNKKQNARALILGDNQAVTLIKRIKGGSTYYVLPGGGREVEDFSIEDTLHRECREELSVDVRVIDTIGVINEYGTEYTIFACEITNGTPTFGNGPEKNTPENVYEIINVPLNDIKNYAVKPDSIFSLIKSYVDENIKP